MGQGLSHRHHQSMVPRVLHIPEILSLIFRLSDTATRRNAALVCKAWMEPALDELWRSITPLPLFRLLAPMRLIGDGDSASQKPIVGHFCKDSKVFLLFHSQPKKKSGYFHRLFHLMPGPGLTFIPIVLES